MTAQPLNRILNRFEVDDVDTVFALLSNPRRRHILSILYEGVDEIPIGELTRRVAAREYDKPVDDLTGTEWKRVYTSIHQSHLPKLDDEGFVRYDTDEGTIYRTENIEEFGPFLRIEDQSTDLFGYLAVLVVLCAGFYGAVLLSGSSFTVVSEVVTGVLVLTLFAVLGFGVFIKMNDVAW